MYVCKCFAFVYIYALFVCLVPKETRRGRLIPWNWTYIIVNHFVGAGIEPWSFGRFVTS